MFEWGEVNPLCQSRLSYLHFLHSYFVSPTEKCGLLWQIDAHAHPCLGVKTLTGKVQWRHGLDVWHVRLTPCRDAAPGAGGISAAGAFLCTSSIWAKAVPWAGHPAAELRSQESSVLVSEELLRECKCTQPLPTSGVLPKCCSPPAWGAVPGAYGILDPKSHRLHWKGLL